MKPLTIEEKGNGSNNGVKTLVKADKNSNCIDHSGLLDESYISSSPYKGKLFQSMNNKVHHQDAAEPKQEKNKMKTKKKKAKSKGR